MKNSGLLLIGQEQSYLGSSSLISTAQTLAPNDITRKLVRGKEKTELVLSGKPPAEGVSSEAGHLAGSDYPSRWNLEVGMTSHDSVPVVGWKSKMDASSVVASTVSPYLHSFQPAFITERPYWTAD